MISSVSFLATEAHDDDGLPHTLEHLIFLGSEEYPYKVNNYDLFFSCSGCYPGSGIKGARVERSFIFGGKVN